MRCAIARRWPVKGIVRACTRLGAGAGVGRPCALALLGEAQHIAFDDAAVRALLPCMLGKLDTELLRQASRRGRGKHEPAGGRMGARGGRRPGQI